MERKDLLGVNGKIFIARAGRFQKNAAHDVHCLSSANPCNTNCLYCHEQCGLTCRATGFFAMTPPRRKPRQGATREKSGRGRGHVSNVAIWGNHSATQYPDFYNAKINGKTRHRSHHRMKRGSRRFIRPIQQRGAAIIKGAVHPAPPAPPARRG